MAVIIWVIIRDVVTELHKSGVLPSMDLLITTPAPLATDLLVLITLHCHQQPHHG